MKAINLVIRRKTEEEIPQDKTRNQDQEKTTAKKKGLYFICGCCNEYIPLWENECPACRSQIDWEGFYFD